MYGNTQNLKNGKLVSLYDNLPFIFERFMTYNMPSSVKKHCEVLSHKFARRPKCCCSSFSSSDGQMVFAQNSSILYQAVTSPSLFHNFEVLRGG